MRLGATFVQIEAEGKPPRSRDNWSIDTQTEAEDPTVSGKEKKKKESSTHKVANATAVVKNNAVAKANHF